LLLAAAVRPKKKEAADFARGLLVGFSLFKD
jgi:hypothetical protein